jgi:hypothetical protein
MANQALSKGSKASASRVSDVVHEVRALAPERQIADPAVVEAAARGWSPNTVRAFPSDIRLWDEWCRRTSVRSGEATPVSVLAYIRALAGTDRESLAALATETSGCVWW